MINHRYLITKKLGEGTSGEVFLATDTLGGNQQCAIKVLHKQDASQKLEQHFLNEIAILTDLYHPNLVRVLDWGIVWRADESFIEGRRFFVMEYVEGNGALDWFRTLQNDQTRVIWLRSFITQALSALSYIHQRGIIHFDVKPENFVIVGSSGKDAGSVTKLADFGFSVRHSDSQHELSLRGTLDYTAPELLKHESFDHRIDLYSFGATIYHIVEGKSPFEDSEAVNLIKRVLTTKPTFHRMVEEPFNQLLPLVQGLLERDVNQRFRSARHAMHVFTTAEGHSLESLGELPAKPIFVGRENERQRITSAIGLLRGLSASEKYVAVTITGPEGIGKTALLTEMMRLAKSMEIPVFEMLPLQGGAPFEAVVKFLHLLRAAILSRFDKPEMIKRFDEVIKQDSDLWQDFMIKPMEARDTIIEAQARIIQESANIIPFVLVLDNADLLDAESAETLRIAVRDVRLGKFLLLCAVRENTLNLGGALKLPLGELDEPSVKTMGTSVFETKQIGEMIGDKLFHQFGGVPAILVEAFYSVAEHLPFELPSEPSEAEILVDGVIGGLPESIDELVVNRFKSLPREHQLILELMSCLRFPVRLGFLQSLLPFRPQATLEYLRFLEASEMVESSDLGELVLIRHDRLKTIVYTTLQSREDVHQFIGATLQQQTGERSFVDLQELAHQFAQSGKAQESARWQERAADEGMAIGAYRNARALYELGAELIQDDPLASRRIRTKLAHAQFLNGEYRESISCATKLLDESEIDNERTSFLHKTSGLALSRLGDYEEAKLHIQQSLRGTTDEKEILELEQELLGIDVSIGNLHEAEQSGIALLKRAQQLSVQRIVASIHTDLGIATFLTEQFEKSEEYFQQSMLIYEELHQTARIADALMNIGNVRSAQGDSESAIGYWKKALTLSEEHGTLNQQWQIQNNLGIEHYKLKRYNEAKEFYGHARRISSKIESKQGLAFVLTNLGEVFFVECEYERALNSWDEAIVTYREMDDARGIVESLLQLAQIYRLFADWDEVSRRLEEVDLLIKQKSLDSFNALLSYYRGILLFSREEFSAAAKEFEIAIQSPEKEQSLLATVRLGECYLCGGNIQKATASFENVLRTTENAHLPQLFAETCLCLGTLSKEHPESGLKKPLNYFKDGMEVVEKESVSELTWKLAFALGGEYLVRGQEERAREAYLKAKVVLQFIVSRFNSEGKKNAYLAAEKRGKTISTLETFLKG